MILALGIVVGVFLLGATVWDLHRGYKINRDASRMVDDLVKRRRGNL